MIYQLEPNRVRRTYLGGGRIDAFTGFSPADDGALRPEDWMASTVSAFNGAEEIEGEGLGRLSGGRLVKDVIGSMPILVKLLDSDERLVIQAHPTVPFAKARLNSAVGKTECWYFLPGTAPNACVYLGFRPGITREKWVAAFDRFNNRTIDQSEQSNNELLDWLHRIPVKAGDFVFVDGGVPHAIGAGCFMIELQEPSDLMVVAERFTPSGRRIPDAKMHGGLGWDGMFDVYEYAGCEFDELCRKYVRRREDLASVHRVVGRNFTDKFEMFAMTEGDLSVSGAKGVAVVTHGEGRLNGSPVRKGDRLVFADESSLRLDGGCEVVVCLKTEEET